MLEGETIHSGAKSKCPDCGDKLILKVLRSPAGFYIGTRCACGPYSRESLYYSTEEEATQDLANNTIKWR